MKVNIDNVEKSQGLVFKKKLYGVALTVTFNEEEKSIISARKIGDDIMLERGTPADIDEEKHANRGIAKKLATAAMKGAGANHFHLTFNKLLRGTDTFFFNTPLEAKAYIAALQETLPQNKEYIMGNAEVAGGGSFEL